jgi:hypothetical protein
VKLPQSPASPSLHPSPCRESIFEPSPCLPLLRPALVTTLAFTLTFTSTLNDQELTWPSPFRSASPAQKRSLKPSPIAASPQQAVQVGPPSDLPSLQSAATAPQDSFATAPQPPTPGNGRKRKSVSLAQPQDQMASPVAAPGSQAANATTTGAELEVAAQEPKAKKSRTNTPWTPAEEQRLKQMRDAGNSWSEIAKVKKHQALLHNPTAHVAPAESCMEPPRLTALSSRPFLSEQKVVSRSTGTR